MAFTPRTRLHSSAEKTLECFEVSGGTVIIFLRLVGIAVFGGVLGAGEIDFHTFLPPGHVTAQAITGGLLLLPETVHATVHGCCAGCEVIDFILKFF